MTSRSNNNRRQTLGVVSNTARRRDSMELSQIPLPPNSTQKQQQTPRGGIRNNKGRKSMIPRVQQGRENNNLLGVPPSPGVTAPTQASRGRSVRGGAAAGGGDHRRQTMGAEGLGSAHKIHNNNNNQHNTTYAASPTRHAFPTTTTGVVRSDPRPIHDKAFQQECIKRLMNFLVDRGYEYAITAKTLARPSAKDFTNIVTFMLRQVDPNFQENTTSGSISSKDGVAMKIEDEVAMNFKALGYPFTMSKTALVAAGSPHTWPTLLAALTWLMEFLELLRNDDFDQEINIENAQPFASLEELEVTTDKVFFAYLHKAYTAFLEGDKGMQEQLVDALADRFDKDDGYIGQEIERITDLNAAIVEKMNAMIEETRELPMLTKKRDDYATDLEQFRDLIRQFDDHVAVLNQKVEERSQELGVTNKKLEKMNAYIEDLKKDLEKQAVSLGDMYKVQSELKGVEEAMDRAVTIKEKLRSSKWESEEQLVNLFTDLESEISAFNNILSEVALLPSMDEQVASLKLTLDRSQALQKDQSKLLGISLDSVVHPTLLQYKDLYVARAAKARQAHQQALDDLEHNKEMLTESLEKLKMLEARKLKMEETLENERNTQEAKLAVRKREVEAIESSVESINDPVALEEQLARYERQCAELEALRLQQQEENLANKKAVEDEIEAACQAIMDLESFCKAKTAEVNQYWLMKMTMNAKTVQSSET